MFYDKSQTEELCLRQFLPKKNTYVLTYIHAIHRRKIFIFFCQNTKKRKIIFLESLGITAKGEKMLIFFHSRAQSKKMIWSKYESSY
jgi:hypothetical protein